MCVWLCKVSWYEVISDFLKLRSKITVKLSLTYKAVGSRHTIAQSTRAWSAYLRKFHTYPTQAATSGCRTLSQCKGHRMHQFCLLEPGVLWDDRYCHCLRGSHVPRSVKPATYVQTLTEALSSKFRLSRSFFAWSVCVSMKTRSKWPVT